jgi:hypothetical protein
MLTSELTVNTDILTQGREGVKQEVRKPGGKLLLLSSRGTAHHNQTFERIPTFDSNVRSVPRHYDV